MVNVSFLNKAGSLELEAEIFAQRFNESLVHEVVRAELGAKRQGTAATKTRGKVRGGGAKPWRQKGTGRARAGSNRSPIWTGGGTVFGPSPRHYTFKVNRKARQAALRSVLSLHAQRDSLAILDVGAHIAPSTKQAAGELAKWEADQPTLIVLGIDELTAAKSFRNLQKVSVISVRDVGVAEIMATASLVTSEAALADLTQRARRPEKTQAVEA